MQDTESVKQLIQQIVPRAPEIIIGRVISEDPLIVQAENDDKLPLDRNALIIPKSLHDDPLKYGERIHILVFNVGKSYYALDRAVT